MAKKDNVSLHPDSSGPTLVRKRPRLTEGEERKEEGGGRNTNTASAAAEVSDSSALKKAFLRSGSEHWIQNSENPDRFDFPGTGDGNELVKHRKDDVDRFVYNFSLHFAYPLHNFLQVRPGLDNEDEIQFLLMPATASPKQKEDQQKKKMTAQLQEEEEQTVAVVKDQEALKIIGYTDLPSPLTKTNKTGKRMMKGSSHNNSKKKEREPPVLMERDCFFASNSDRITQQHIDAALKEWKLMGVFHIRSITVVTGGGQPGRHAEQKLLEHLSAISTDYGITRSNRALIVGERLPCAACRVFASRYEHLVEMMPSHGHFYLSTAAMTPGLPSAKALPASSELSKKKKKMKGGDQVTSAHAETSDIAEVIPSPLRMHKVLSVRGRVAVPTD